MDAGPAPSAGVGEPFILPDALPPGPPLLDTVLPPDTLLIPPPSDWDGGETEWPSPDLVPEPDWQAEPWPLPGVVVA